MFLWCWVGCCGVCGGECSDEIGVYGYYVYIVVYDVVGVVDECCNLFVGLLVC